MKTTKVWDLSVRIFHWTLAALVGAAFLTGDDETISWHARGGILIAGLLAYRVIWGLSGPAPARFRSFVRGPRVVIEYLRGYLRGRPKVHLTHNPLGALMVVALLAVLFGAVVTGALAYSSAEWDGPLSAVIG
ncbi:MAG TPA: cytochrome b/b6 domain-containing protein, partial [Vulgatibacter sp.]